MAQGTADWHGQGRAGRHAVAAAAGGDAPSSSAVQRIHAPAPGCVSTPGGRDSCALSVLAAACFAAPRSDACVWVWGRPSELWLPAAARTPPTPPTPALYSMDKRTWGFRVFNVFLNAKKWRGSLFGGQLQGKRSVPGKWVSKSESESKSKYLTGNTTPTLGWRVFGILAEFWGNCPFCARDKARISPLPFLRQVY